MIAISLRQVCAADNKILYQKNQRQWAGEMTQQLSVLFAQLGRPRVRVLTTHMTSPANSA